MTRSRRHTPIVGTCGDGAGPYRQIRAGQERARVRSLLDRERWDEADVETARWNEWDCSRDGKTWVGPGRWSDCPPSRMRK